MTRLNSLQGRMDITPWDVILDQVQRAAFRSAWVDSVCDTIINEMNEQADLMDDPEADGSAMARIEYKNLRTELKEWLKESRDERKHLTATAKQAIDLDIQKYLVMKVEMNGRLIAKVLGDAMDSAQLDSETRRRMVSGLRNALEGVSGDGGSGQPRGLEESFNAFGKVMVDVIRSDGSDDVDNTQ